MSLTINKINALKVAAQTKRKNTLLKVQTTLRIMQEKNLPINFQSVAKLAGVSKSWLYQQENISSEIKNMRIKSGKIKRVIEMQSIITTRNNKIDMLIEKNKKLKLENKDLKKQLEIVYGALYKLKKE